jgi:HAD superfamily hydrolase (TIGR01509 family)
VGRVEKRVELVIFDCDGVLVDSEPIAVSIDVQTLAGFGMTCSEAEIIERFVGRSQSVMREAIEAHTGQPLPEDWEVLAERGYRDAFRAELQAIAGLEDALAQIRVRTCVASGSVPESIRFKLELTGLYAHFEGRIFSSVEVEHGKPAPDLFLHAAERMGVEPSRCVVVEDSLYGVQAARAAGMRVLAYTGAAMTPPTALAGPDTHLFDDMRELPGLLRTLGAQAQAA